MKTLVLAVCVVLVLGTTGLADEFAWDNPAGGLYSESDNWDPNGVPGVDDTVWFNLPGAYTVTFDMDRNNDILYANGSDVTLDLAGFKYSLDYSSEGSPAVVIGRNGTSSLTVNNGIVHSREVSIGQYSSAVGSLALSGSGTEWGTSFDSDWHGVWIGEDGDATLAVLDGAYFNHGHGCSAFSPDSDAVIEVNGANSRWYVDGQFDMSVSGRTTVDIRNGGLVDIGRLTMGLYGDSSAEINVYSIDQYESKLILHAGHETSLTIGLNGQAAVRLYNSKLLNHGSMMIGENPGSNGLLELHDGSMVECPNSISVGGSFGAAGGIGEIRIVDEEGVGTVLKSTQREGQSIVVWSQGTIAMDGGSIDMIYNGNDDLANAITLQDGTLEGNGVIWAHVGNYGGVVAPNDDQGNKVLEMKYNYSQDAAGTLKIALGGQEPVSQYSHLRVTRENYGQVWLDGSLDVDLVDGFVPKYDDRFEIIAAQNISGTFSNAVSTYVFESGSFEVSYNTESFDSVSLTHFIPAPEPHLVEFVFAPGLVYDSHQNITFLKNWALAKDTMNWSQANDWAANFTYVSNGVTYSNWRLPVTIDQQAAVVGELGSLVTMYGVNADRPAPFVKVSEGDYWTSPLFSRDPDPAIAYTFTYSTTYGPAQYYQELEYSNSYVIPVFDGPPTGKWCPADFNNNGIVNLEDLAEFASYWLSERPGPM